MAPDTASLRRDLHIIAARHGVTLPPPPTLSPEADFRQQCKGELLGFVGRREEADPARAERAAAKADLATWQAERTAAENARRRSMP